MVCSDLIGRGIDLDNVQYVFSYDVPWYMDKYIHRVGRTARAGKQGTAYSIVETKQLTAFKDMLRKGGHLDRVQLVRITKKKLDDHTATYEDALANLKEEK